MAHTYRGLTGAAVLGGVLDGSPVVAALAALDTCTDVTGTNLEAHTPDSGFSGWTESTAGGVTIQGNKAQVALATLGGSEGILAAPATLAQDKFTAYADLMLHGTGSRLGFAVRSKGTLAIGADEYVAVYVSSVASAQSIQLSVSRYASGVLAENFVIGTIAPTDAFGTGFRLGADVAGNVVTVWWSIYGGGTKTVVGTATLVTGWNDSSHKGFRLLRSNGSGEVGSSWDNVTLITGGLSGAASIAVGVVSGALRGVLMPGDTFTIPSETGTPTHTVGGAVPLVVAGNAIAAVPISPNLASDVIPGSAIVFTSNAMVQTKSWVATPKVDMLDASAQGTAWKIFVPGLASWVGKLQLMLDLNDAKHLALHTKLMTAAPTTTPFGLVLRVPPDGLNPGFQWYGLANLSNWRTSAPVNQLVLADADFQGTSALLAN